MFLVSSLTATGKSEKIPANVGSGSHRKKVQQRTLISWLGLASIGFLLFNNTALQPGVRAAALTLLFPGAGYIACANVFGLILLGVTYAILPVCLFAWFGAGAIFFPIAVWVSSAAGAYFTAGDGLFEKSGFLSVAVLSTFMCYFNRISARARKTARVKRQVRNNFLPGALAAVDKAAQAPAAGRELELADLRDIQWTIDQGLRPLDDWTNFTVIDQFQTSALRYQLYEMMYCLGAYQGIYTPNFHGYASEAFRNAIEKSLTPTVLGFWRWETLWGKFKTDYEPVNKDNIMVTGFLLQSAMLYTANTGDMRYTEPGSMKFQVTKKNVYSHDIHSISGALVAQWKEDPFCLFSCEPNWIYTPCNLQGMTGQVIYDRVFGTHHAKDILPLFEESLNTNFTEEDGSILPIRSEITGFTIPGLCGALTDLVNAVLCRGHMDHIARRMWAIFRHECVLMDGHGGLELKGLMGADKIDPGNYQSNKDGILPMLAYVAGEYGDEEVRKAALAVLNTSVGKYTTETGATALNKDRCSNSMNSCMVRSSLLRKDDWKSLISTVSARLHWFYCHADATLQGPSPVTLAGPILDEVPYPGVLVAKARSNTSRDLDMVLYPSTAGGVFKLGIKRLQAGQKYYHGGREATFVANERGEAYISILVEGRTQVHIQPVPS